LGPLTNVSAPLCQPGVPHGQKESGGIALLLYAGPRMPRGGVTRQGVVLTDLKSLLDLSIKLLSLSLSRERERERERDREREREREREKERVSKTLCERKMLRARERERERSLLTIK